MDIHLKTKPDSATAKISGDYVRYGDSSGNTTEENSSVFSLIRMC